MGNLFAELKRRHIYRVAAAYVVVAWLLLQVINNVAPFMRLPDWAGGFFLVALLIGFPVALLFAWIHELAPESAQISCSPTGNLDWVLSGAVLAVVGLFAYQQFAPPRTTGATNVQAGVEAARVAATSPAGISIAVLPFSNLSSDKEQEFFSDGMTEEITTALAKVPDLRVVGRTSAFQFKGQNLDLRDIGQKLNATHLIEGSVRKAGDRLRITAQLIKADDGTHLWAEDYDRQLTDIFQIQEDIARAIATSLRMPLGLKPGDSLVRGRTKDLESYQQYLRGRALIRARSVDEAMAVLKSVVARDPGFAPAWALLAMTYNLAAARDPDIGPGRPVDEARRVLESYRESGERAAREAIRLDPDDPGAIAALSSIELRNRRWAAAEDLVRKALALDPADTDILDGYSQRLVRAGYLKDALRLREQMSTLEPFVPFYNRRTAAFMRYNGQAAASIAIFEKDARGDPFANGYLAEAYAAAGRFGEAADALLRITDPRLSRQSLEEAARLLRSAPRKAAAAQAHPAWDYRLNFVYLYLGEPERILEEPERVATLGGSGPALESLWSPEAAPVRKTERFKALMRKVGIADYWKARGWPELCHPTTSDDFICE